LLSIGLIILELGYRMDSLELALSILLAIGNSGELLTLAI
jgi:hypothetical protein